jgi:hypothetical protein
MKKLLIQNAVYLILLPVLILIFVLPVRYLISATEYGHLSGSLLLLPVFFGGIILIALIIVFAAAGRDNKEHTLFLLSSISLKLLAEMVLALFWFYDGKNSSSDSVLLFFVLYLSFSLFYVTAVLKTLKKKTL